MLKGLIPKAFFLILTRGLMIENGEGCSEIAEGIQAVSHVHISEQGLKPVEKRELYVELMSFLKQEGYDKFVSIEMGKQENLDILEKEIDYVKSLVDWL